MLRCFAVMRCGTSTEIPQVVMTPAGVWMAYQRFANSFTGDRRPVSVVTRVPVAGSSITDSGLLGEWCAEVFLDDEEAPIARRRFELLAP